MEATHHNTRSCRRKDAYFRISPYICFFGIYYIYLFRKYPIYLCRGCGSPENTGISSEGGVGEWFEHDRRMLFHVKHGTRNTEHGTRNTHSSVKRRMLFHVKHAILEHAALNTRRCSKRQASLGVRRIRGIRKKRANSWNTMFQAACAMRRITRNTQEACQFESARRERRSRSDERQDTQEACQYGRRIPC